MAKRDWVDTDTKLLKALSRRGYVLERRETGDVIRCGTLLREVQPGLVDAALSFGSLSDAGGEIRLTKAGKSALRRALATHDEFRSQHQQRRFGEVGAPSGEPIVVAIAETTTPLSWLRQRKGRNGKPLISDAQLQAGERLSTDFERSHHGARLTSNWSTEIRKKSGRKYGGTSGQGHEVSIAVSQSQARVRAALRAVGPELAGILVDICCHHRGLADAERIQGFPQRSGKIVLRLALSALARHYNIPDDHGRSRGFDQNSVWRDADAVPDLSAWRTDPEPSQG